MNEILRRAERNGWSSYFYGGRAGLGTVLSARLLCQYPSLKICGSMSPPFRPISAEETRCHAAVINEANPTIVWVGLSTPKQEKWMAAARPYLNASVLVGVGAAFDMQAGTLRAAPVWIRNTGLEWLFRLILEPKRLWRRYARIIPRFAVAVCTRPPRLN
jgi:N-acetylglucosaminyldiphosphoundecaprenol N-acetyl-beta-D-mannosaminyltransferase